MSQLQEARTGLGGGPDPFGIGIDDPNSPWFGDEIYRTVTPPPTTIFTQAPSTPRTPSNTPTYLAMLGLGLEKTLSNIFAPAATSAAQAQYAQQYQIPGARYDASGRLLSSSSGGIGIGIDGQGIRLSDGSHIGWFPIVAVIGVVYLIQSPGFLRRSR